MGREVAVSRNIYDVPILKRVCIKCKRSSAAELLVVSPVWRAGTASLESPCRSKDVKLFSLAQLMASFAVCAPPSVGSVLLLDDEVQAWMMEPNLSVWTAAIQVRLSCTCASKEIFASLHGDPLLAGKSTAFLYGSRLTCMSRFWIKSFSPGVLLRPPVSIWLARLSIHMPPTTGMAP